MGFLADSLEPEDEEQPSVLKPVEAPAGFLAGSVENEARESQVDVNMYNASQDSPDNHIRNKKLSDQTNLPVDTVARNYDSVEKQQKAAQQKEASELRKNNPALYRYWQDSNNANATYDDGGAFEEIENFFKDLRQVGTDMSDRFDAGFKNIESNEIGFQRAMFAIGVGDDITPEQMNTLEVNQAFSQKIQARTDDYGLFTGVPVASAEMLPQLINQEIEGAKGFGIGFGIGAPAGALAALVGGQLGPQAAALEEIVTVPVSTVAMGIRVGLPARTVAKAYAMFKIETGAAANEMLQIEGLDKRMVGSAAIAVGIVNGAMELFSLKKLGDTVTPFKRIIKDKVMRAMQTTKGKKALTSLAKTYATSVGTETITEFLQSYVQTGAKEFVTIFGDEDSENDSIMDVLSAIGSEENLDNALAEAKIGFQATLGIGGVTTSASAVVNNYRTKTASVGEQERIDKLAAIVNESKTVTEKRGTDIIKSYMQEVIDEHGGDDTVFIPVEDIDVEALAEFEGEAFEIINEQFEQALAEGSDVVIPMSVFAADVMTNEQAYNLLRNSVRLSTDTLTNNEAQAYDADNVIKVQKLVEEANKHADIKQEATEIHNRITEQLVATGRLPEQSAGVSAQIIPAYVTTQAVRQGKTVTEIYESMGVSVIGPTDEQVGGGINSDGSVTLPAGENFTSVTGSGLVTETNTDGNGNTTRVVKSIEPKPLLDRSEFNTDEEFNNYEALRKEVDTEIANGKQVLSELGGSQLSQQDDIDAQGISDTLGIDVTEITDEKQIEQFNALLQASRSEVSTEQDPLTTVSGKKLTSKSLSSTAVKGLDGKPYIIHRGAPRQLSVADYDAESLGKNTNNPSASFGVWGVNTLDYASGFGKTESFYLNLQNPKLYTIDTFPNLADSDAYIALREQLQAEGYDGAIIDDRDDLGTVQYISFDPDQFVQLPEATVLTPLETIEVDIATLDVTTGKQSTVKTTADQALKDVDESLATLNEVMKCLSS